MWKPIAFYMTRTNIPGQLWFEVCRGTKRGKTVSVWAAMEFDFPNAEGNVHAVSDSVLCVGHGAMSEPSRKFNNKWTHNQKDSGTTTSTDRTSKFIDCTFHVNPTESFMQLLADLQTTVSSAPDAVGNGLHARDQHPQHHLHGYMNEATVSPSFSPATK